MTPERQREVIAEILGIHVYKYCGDEPELHDSYFAEIPPTHPFYGKLRLQKCNRCDGSAIDGRWSEHSDADEYPDYCADLNAMRDARITLSADQQAKYGMHVASILHLARSPGFYGLFLVATLPADQHAEAFIRTHNRWEG